MRMIFPVSRKQIVNFIATDLLEGVSYIIIGKSKMGAFCARCELIPITDCDQLYPRTVTLINNKAPNNTPESIVNMRNSKKIEFIENTMDHYENEWNDAKDFPHISADMAIPIDAMN